MSPASQPLKVLVTGASGFVAAWVVRALLERGYHVRGTVRSDAKGEYLKRVFKDYADKFEYVIVRDIEEDGAFDEAVKGMDFVVHTASPFHLQADDPQELIGPAVKGTTGILESILKNAPNVRRVVVTSSTAAVSDIPPPSDIPRPSDPPKNQTYNEKDWNNQGPKIIAEQGRNAAQTHKYRTSKVLAEKAAWEFLDKHKSDVKWNLVTLQPPFVFGPIIHDVPSASQLNTSNANVLAFLRNDPPKTSEDLALSAGSFIDVRDLAWAHAEALTNDRVANKDKNAAFNEGKGRIVLSAHPFTWQDVADALIDASISVPSTMPKGVKGAGKNAFHPVLLDSTRARELLGLEFRSTADTMGDLVKSFKEKGWIE